MTSPRDEIDDWLGGEVTAAQPAAGLAGPDPAPGPAAQDPAGRLRRGRLRRGTRGRRRRAAARQRRQAGRDPIPRSAIGARAAVRSTRARRQHATSATSNTSASAPDHAAHRLSTTHVGTPPPPHFRPTSVTFVGSRRRQRRRRGHRPGRTAVRDQYCTSLAGTSDYGSTWYGVSAPIAPGPDGSTGVSQLRFANLRDGWAFGPALVRDQRRRLAVAPGGHRRPAGHRRRGRERPRLRGVRHVHRHRSRLRRQLHQLLALHLGRGQHDLDACDGAVRLRAMTSTTSAAPLMLIAGGATVYVLTPTGEVLSGPVTGGTWQAAGPAPCKPGPSTWRPRTRRIRRAARIRPGAAADLRRKHAAPSKLSRLSTPRRTAPAGARPASWPTVDRARSAPPRRWRLRRAGQVVLATTTGIQYSRNHGRLWRAARVGGGVPAGGFSYVGMTTASKGVAVPANSSLGEIFVTRDGGKTWSPSLISR